MEKMAVGAYAVAPVLPAHLRNGTQFLQGAHGEGGFCRSHLVTVPPGPHLSDALISSPVIQGEDGTGAIGLGVGGFEFGVDPNEDPELALVSNCLLHQSLSVEGNLLLLVHFIPRDNLMMGNIPVFWFVLHRCWTWFAFWSWHSYHACKSSLLWDGGAINENALSSSLSCSIWLFVNALFWLCGKMPLQRSPLDYAKICDISDQDPKPFVFLFGSTCAWGIELCSHLNL